MELKLDIQRERGGEEEGGERGRGEVTGRAQNISSTRMYEWTVSQLRGQRVHKCSGTPLIRTP